MRKTGVKFGVYAGLFLMSFALVSCSVNLPTKGDHVILAWFEQPGFLFSETGPVQVESAVIRGRKYRGIALESTLIVERPVRIPELADLVLSIAGEGTKRALLSLTVTFNRADTGETREIYTASLDFEHPAKEWVEPVRISLEKEARQWGMLRLELSVTDVEEGGRVWLLDPYVTSQIPPREPWAPIHDLETAQQKFQELQTHYHILWIWLPDLAFDDLHLEWADSSPWAPLSTLIADGAIFEKVVPVTGNTADNLAVAMSGEVQNDGLNGPALLLRRAMYQPALLLLGLNYPEEATKAYVDVRKDLTEDEIVGWLEGKLRQKKQQALVALIGGKSRDEQKAGAKKVIRAFEKAGILDQTVIYVVGTGRVSEADVEPGFLAIRVPGGVDLPNDRVTMPMSVQDVLPTMVDVLGVSHKDLKFAGTSRFGWMFQWNHELEEPVWSREGSTVWAVFNDWKLRLDGESGEVVDVRPMDPRRASEITESWDGFLRRFIGAWYRERFVGEEG